MGTKPKNIKSRYVSLDFDGTLVTHEYPNVGRDIGAVPWLEKAAAKGAKFILLTMRDGKHLEDAVEWCEKAGVRLESANDNAPGLNWSESRKVYAHLYIDDAALGVPLVHPPVGRPYVDWDEVGPLLLEFLD